MPDWRRPGRKSGGQAGPYGVDAANIELVDDGKGLGSLWPYLRFTVFDGEPMTIGYRVTVTQPLE